MPKKIIELPVANVVNDSTLIPVVNSGVTQRASGTQIKTYIDDYVDSTLDLGNVAQNILPDADNTRFR